MFRSVSQVQVPASGSPRSGDRHVSLCEVGCPATPGRTFCTSSSPALAGRGTALHARSALAAPLPGRRARAVPNHGPSRDVVGVPRDSARGILVRSQRHRPHRAPQPRCAQLAADPGPILRAVPSPGVEAGRGRRRAVPGLTHPARSMRQRGRRGWAGTDQGGTKIVATPYPSQTA